MEITTEHGAIEGIVVNFKDCGYMGSITGKSRTSLWDDEYTQAEEL